MSGTLLIAKDTTINKIQSLPSKPTQRAGKPVIKQEI